MGDLLQKRPWRIAIGAIGGAVVMLGVSWVAGHTLPGCTLLCDPKVASFLGFFSGALALSDRPT